MAYIIFITFPTVSVFGCLKIEHRKKNFHFVSLSLFFYSLSINKTLIFRDFFFNVGMVISLFFLQAT